MDLESIGGWKGMLVIFIIAIAILYATEPKSETYSGWYQKCGSESRQYFRSESKHSPTYYTSDKYLVFYNGEDRTVALNVCDMEMVQTSR